MFFIKERYLGQNCSRFSWYNQDINTKFSIDELIAIFLKKGGRINSYYLQGNNQSKHTLIYLKGWFAGKNIREALTKALAQSADTP